MAEYRKDQRGNYYVVHESGHLAHTEEGKAMINIPPSEVPEQYRQEEDKSK